MDMPSCAPKQKCPIIAASLSAIVLASYAPENAKSPTFDNMCSPNIQYTRPTAAEQAIVFQKSTLFTALEPWMLSHSVNFDSLIHLAVQHLLDQVKAPFFLVLKRYEWHS